MKRQPPLIDSEAEVKIKESSGSSGLLTGGPVGSILFKQALTMMVGMAGMLAFNLVDTFFVGRLGTMPLAAMSFTLPVVIFYGSISMGLGVGASAIISRAAGRGSHAEVQRLTTDSLLLSILIVTLLMLLGLATMNPLFRLLGAEGEVLAQVGNYMNIWYMGVPFVVIPMVGNSAIRASGNIKIPTLIMLISFGVNAILDPFLIYGIGIFPRLELQGAALATVIARTFSLCASLYFLFFRFDMLTFRKTSLREIMKSWGSVLHVGVPASVSNVMMPVCMGIITRLIAPYGSAAVAAFGVGHRLETLAFLPLMSVGAVLTPFVGQNAGAGFYDRVALSLQLVCRFSLLMGGVGFVIFLLWGTQLSALFNSDPAVYKVSGLYLSIISAGFGLHGCAGTCGAVCSALKRPLIALGIVVLRLIVLYVPLAWLGSMYFGLSGIFFAGLVSSILSGFYALWKVKRVLIEVCE
jgi:putative MATE family efflux protein